MIRTFPSHSGFAITLSLCFAVLALLFATMVLTPLTAGAATYYCDWVGAASGYWRDDANPDNWSCGMPFGPTQYYGDTVYVTIDGGAEQSFTITANGDNSATTLEIGANDAVVSGIEGRGLLINDQLTNRGTIYNIILSAPAASNLVIDGGGTMIMSGGSIGGHSTSTIRNDDNRIEGYGNIALLENYGSIVANSDGNVLGYNGNVNQGLLTATSGGILSLSTYSSSLDNTNGSIVSATGSLIRFDRPGGMQVTAGSLQIDGDAEVYLVQPTIFEGTTINNSGFLRVGSAGMITAQSIPNSSDAEIVIENSGKLTLAVTDIVNQGKIRLAGDSAAAQLVLQAGSDHVFSGGGEIILTNQNYNAILPFYDNPSAQRLVNQDNTIHGEGYIDCPLVNNHLVVADHPDRTLFIRNSLTNNGTLWVENNATMQVAATMEGSGEVIVDGGTFEVIEYAQVGTYPTSVINGGHLLADGSDFHPSPLTMDASARLTIKSETRIILDDDFTFSGTDETAWNIENTGGLKMTGGLGAGIGQCNRFVSLEVGGSDMGDVPEGYNDNFHLGVLYIGPGAHVRLVDAVDNGNRQGSGGGPEALYVHTINFEDENGILHLNGLNLYYESILINGMPVTVEQRDERIIDNPCNTILPAVHLLLN